MTLQTLLNKKVITADGKAVGKVYDFKAACQGSSIIVTHIRVGAAAWLMRLGIPGWVQRSSLGQQGFDLPWQAIATADSSIHLKEGWDRVRCESYRIDENNHR
jgi:sporulation protein YlmC with PRC-barrel domain